MIRPFWEKLNFIVYGGLISTALAAAGGYFFLYQDLPRLPDNLSHINLSLPTEIYSADGERIKVLGERHPVGLDEISPYFLKAVIAVEDSRFYEHSGLDHRALLRALYSNLRNRRITQGGSTITQQLSKNLFFSFERNWGRKIKELLIAFQMEATFSKDEILEAYCNQIYFGSGAYGVEEASQTYFAKRAVDLTLLQAALLAGIPNSPKNANPFTNYERAMGRAGLVLTRMVGEGFITETEKQEALESPLDLAHPRVDADPNLYFVDYVIHRLEQDYGREFVHFGGLKIYTTLDGRFQKYALKGAQSHLEVLEKRLGQQEAGGPLQVALVAVENKSGAVRAMLGGRDYSSSQFNRAVSSNRLPGSSFKPFVYFTALETLNYSPATVVRDEPTLIKNPGSPPWEPKNFEDQYFGDIILKKALMKSINVVSAKLIQQVTPSKVIQTARQFGIQSPLGNNLSLALGTSGVSPLEMASAFSVIASLGVYNEPYFIQRIEDFHGNRLYEHFFHGVQRFSRKSVYPLMDMMRGVVEGGTGRMVRRMGFNHPAGGKTGTTNEYRDAWFDGFTKDYSVSVWVGYDDNRPMLDRSQRGLTGASAAVPIWVFFMQKALQGKSKFNFPVPEGIKFENVDVRTGTLPTEYTLETINVAVKKEVDLNPPVEQEDSTAETVSLPSPLAPRGDHVSAP